MIEFVVRNTPKIIYWFWMSGVVLQTVVFVSILVMKCFGWSFYFGFTKPWAIKP